MPGLGLRLTPQGRLLLEAVPDAPFLDNGVAGRLSEAFARGSGHGLMRLGVGEVGEALRSRNVRIADEQVAMFIDGE